MSNHTNIQFFALLALGFSMMSLSPSMAAEPLPEPGEALPPVTSTNSFPPNPLEKPGWVLTVHDEFEGPELTPDLWVPDYLGSITEAERSRPRYELRDGCLVLKIEQDQLPYWTHKPMKASGIQTAQKPRLRPHFKAVRDIPAEMKFTQKYGYFEIRAKTYVAEGYHSYTARSSSPTPAQLKSLTEQWR